MLGLRSTDKLIEQINLLKFKVAVYESKEPINEVVRNFENRVKYATEKMNEYKAALHNSNCEVKRLQKELSKARNELAKAEKRCAAKEAALKDEICKLKAQLDHDGTTSGIPTSKTPVNKAKIIPSSRVKSDKAKGVDQCNNI